MYFKNRKFLVYGMGKSGLADCKYILSRGGSVYLTDDDIEKLKKNSEILAKSNIIICDIKWCLDNVTSFDVLVLSPGVGIDCELCKKCKAKGIRITGDLELGVNYMRNPVISVTGTNGKTTTVNMISDVLNKAGIANFKVGNVGVPFCDSLNRSDDEIAVAEVSSFQTESVKYFEPYIAVVTNITPNHLDRHYRMKYYAYLKEKTLLNQNTDDYAVLNFDDEIVQGFCKDIKSKILYFSCKEKVDGAYLKDGKIYFKNEFVMNANDLSLKHPHNIMNALSAICVCKILGATNKDVINALSDFKGEPHRIEYVKSLGNIAFFDDSKSTNTASSVACVKSFKESMVLLLGGKSKGESYDEFIEFIKRSNVRQIILFGETRFDILACATAHDFTNVTVCKDFDTAVKVAVVSAREGEVVALSPACSSKDEFMSFEERGERFKEIIRNIDEKTFKAKK